MTTYLNMKTKQGVETVDEVSIELNQSPKEFRVYLAKMIAEYKLAGIDVYRSSRCTKEWARKDKKL